MIPAASKLLFLGAGGAPENGVAVRKPAKPCDNVAMPDRIFMRQPIGVSRTAGSSGPGRDPRYASWHQHELPPGGHGDR